MIILISQIHLKRKKAFRHRRIAGSIVGCRSITISPANMDLCNQDKGIVHSKPSWFVIQE